MNSYGLRTQYKKVLRLKKKKDPAAKFQVSNRNYKNREFLNHLDIVEGYLKCKKLVIGAGFKTEIDWQRSVSIHQLTERQFLREHAWVTLASGMREKVIRNLFQAFSNAFFDWKSAELITENKVLCKESAFEIFANENKINAILLTSWIIAAQGFKEIKKLIVDNPEKTLRQFPYIGPVTYYHLAKNIGLPVAKPDRHLVRLASDLNFCDVQTLCGYIGGKTGDSIPVVDIVLWRYATITKDYIMKFIQMSK